MAGQLTFELGWIVGGRFHPADHGGQLCGIRIVFRIPCFKVTLPRRTCEVIILEDHTVTGVVQDFPAFITVLKAKNFRRALVVVEVILAQECCGSRYRVLEEGHDWEAINAPSDSAVGRHSGCFDRTAVIV